MQKYIQAISWNLLFLFLFLCLLATCKSLVNLIKHKNGTMNIQHRYYNCILLLLICLRSADIYSMDIKQNINWPQFMSQQDMIWERLPEYWYDSATIIVQKEMYSEFPDYLPGILLYTLKEK